MKAENQPSKSMTELLPVDQLIAAVVQFAFGSTRNPDAVSKMFASAIRKAETAKNKLAKSARYTDNLTRVFHEWSSNPEYLDRDGTPMALTIKGQKKSIFSLVKNVGGRSHHKTLSAILRSDTLQKAARGKLKMRKTYFDCKHNEQLYRHHACLTALRFFQTVNSNVHGKPPLIERTAAISDLPRHAEKDFRYFSEDQGEELLKTINRWLEGNRKKQRGRNRNLATVEAGVHVFTFIRSSKRPNKFASHF